jgi:hypothetical protein
MFWVRITLAHSSAMLSMSMLRPSLLQAGGDARGGHGRLLGRHREVQQVDEHEAQRVVHAEQEGFHQRRGAQVGHQDLEQRHEADHQPGAGRGHEHAAQLLAVVGHVVLAGVAGVFGDVARQQVDIVAQQVAHHVFVVVRLDQFQSQRHGGVAARIVLLLVDQEQQLAHAVQALRQRHQQVGEGDAGALAQRLLADLGDHRVALVEHDQQVARVFELDFFTGQLALVGVEIGVDLEVLHHEGRFVGLHLGVEIGQARLQADGAHAVGQGADRIEQAGQHEVAVVRRGVLHHIEQGQPVFGRHRGDPQVVGALVDDLVQRFAQVVVAQRRRQDAVGDAGAQFGEEAVVGQHADLGVQAGVAAGRKQLARVVVQRQRVGRIALQQLAQGAHVGGGGRTVVGALGAQRGEQLDHQADIVTLRIDSFEDF